MEDGRLVALEGTTVPYNLATYTLAIPVASKQGPPIRPEAVYWGRYPFGNAPDSTGQMSASAFDATFATASFNKNALTGAALDLTSASASLSTGVALHAPASDTTSASGNLGTTSPLLARVVGNQLLDGSGNVLQVFGANFSGLETSGVQGQEPWYGRTPNWPYARTWGFKIVRIPLDAASWLGLDCLTVNAARNGWVSETTTNADPFGNYKAAVIAAVVAAQAQGFLVILDLHWSAPPLQFAGDSHFAMPQGQPPFMNPFTDLQFWATDAQSIAEVFGTQATPQPGVNNSGVMFELFNEPFLDQMVINGAQLGNNTSTWNLMKNGGTVANFGWVNPATGQIVYLPTNQSWQVLGYQQVLKEIRATGAKNVCLIGGCGFSHALSGYNTYAPVDPLAAGSMTNPLLTLPAYTDLDNVTYISGATHNKLTRGQLGIAPASMPASKVFVLSENANPLTGGDGFYTQNPWNAGAMTGFSPTISSGFEQLSVAATGQSSTMQCKNGRFGFLMLGSDLNASKNRPQFTLQQNFTDDAGTGVQMFPDSSVVVTNTMTGLQVKTYTPGATGTQIDSPYLHNNTGTTPADGSFEFAVNVAILDGSPLSPAGHSLPSQGGIGSYFFVLPFGAGGTKYATFMQGSYQNGVFDPTTFQWSINYAQMAAIINFMATTAGFAAQFAPGGVQRLPSDFTLLQAHINAEMPNGAANAGIAIGWNITGWTISASSAAGGQAQLAATMHPYPAGSYPYADGNVYGLCYPDPYTGAAWDTAAKKVAAKVPLLLTEDGGTYGPAATSGEPHVTYMLNWVKANNISAYVQWEFWDTVPITQNGENDLVTLSGTTYAPTVGQGATFLAGIGGGGGPPPVATPTLSKGTGTYPAAFSLAITDDTSGASIFWNTGTSMPTNASTPYSGTIAVNGSEQINAIAYVGSTASAVATGIYTITPVSGALVMYANGVLNAPDWLTQQNLNNNGFSYKSTTNLQAGTQFNCSLTGGANYWLQPTNWAPLYQQGLNGVDVSPYTRLSMDIWSPVNNGQFQLSTHYLRGDEYAGADVQCTSYIPSVDALPGINLVAGWNIGVEMPLAYLAYLSNFNSYKILFQNLNGASCNFNNVEFVAGNTEWISRGNSTLEVGWTDASSNASANYNWLPQSINAGAGGLFSLSNPPRAAANFTGSISGTQLTVSGTGYTGGAMAVGDQLFYGTVGGVGPGSAPTVQNPNPPPACYLQSGSGTTWTLTENLGNVGSQGMMSVASQYKVPAIALTVSAVGGLWKATIAGGTSLSNYGYFTFGAMPTKAPGNSYKVQAYNAAGVAVGTTVTIAPGSTTYTPNDFGVNKQNFTVYCIPLSALGVASATIGGISIQDNSGAASNLIYLSAIGFFS